MKAYGKLTNKQKEVLDYIKSFCASNKYPPSVREICHGLGISSPATIHTHIKKLVEKGYIQRGENGNKQLKLLVNNEYENSNSEITSVPLLGKITAGTPIEAIEMPDEYFALPAYLIPQRKEVFTLRVEGDSMVNAGIHSGDIIIVERCKTAKNGDMVVAMSDEHEVTLKTFYKEKGYIRLQPENDFMNPIILKTCTILGKPIGLYRKF